MPNSLDNLTPVNAMFREDKENGIDRSFMRAFEDNHQYQTGFAKAFKAVGGMITDTHNHDLFFPTVYLFRHYVELECKYILESSLPANTPIAKQLLVHDLSKLWANARSAIEATMPHITAESLDRIGRLILELNDADPGGDEARYASKRDGKASLDSLPNQIDLSQMLHEMERVHNFLSDWSYEIRQLVTPPPNPEPAAHA